MTGVFSPKVHRALASVSGYNGPKDIEHIRGLQPVKKERLGAGPYAIPYANQTGPTKYAPADFLPPTKIMMETPTPQYPTSPYQIKTDFVEPATVHVTLTEANTLPLPTMENTVCVTPFYTVEVNLLTGNDTTG
jgi:hypothetical protein